MRKLFKGGNYSREYSIKLFFCILRLWWWATRYGRMGRRECWKHEIWMVPWGKCHILFINYKKSTQGFIGLSHYDRFCPILSYNYEASFYLIVLRDIKQVAIWTNRCSDKQNLPCFNYARCFVEPVIWFYQLELWCFSCCQSQLHIW